MIILFQMHKQINQHVSLEIYHSFKYIYSGSHTTEFRYNFPGLLAG